MVQNVYAGLNRRVLVQADVVGVTTAGLARNIKMLRKVGIKVIICKEAAYVMEPHFISALIRGVQHLSRLATIANCVIKSYLRFSMETTTGRAY